MGVAHADPFLVQIGPKKAILEVLLNFFRTTGVQHKLLVLIESHNIFNWKSEWVWSKLVQCCEKTKKMAISIGFFHILHEEHLKARSSGYKNTGVQIEGQCSKKYHT